MNDSAKGKRVEPDPTTSEIYRLRLRGVSRRPAPRD